MLILLSLLFLAFLLWRFHDCKLRRNDDFSHWGTLARFLVLRDRLPVEADHVLTHQSYPPGSACFIYFFSNLIGPRENIYLAAQGLLHGVALLPLFALVDARERRTLLPITGLMALALLIYPCHDVDLLVDHLQPFFGIGIAATIAYYRQSPNRALWASLPALIAVALFKNSGLFFSLSSALILICALRANGRGAKSRGRALIALAAPPIAYLLWMLRVRLCFPAAGAGKHSISPALYAQHLADKGASGALGVVKGMLASMLRLGNWRLGIVAMLLALALALQLLSMRLPTAERRHVRRAIRFVFALYLVWLLLIFFMYVFSMTGTAALEASSFARYNGTGCAYAAGLLIIPFLEVVPRGEISLPPRFLRTAGAASTLALAFVLALAIVPGAQTPIDEFFIREQTYTYAHACLTDVWTQNPALYGKRCLFFALHDEDQYFRTLHYIRNAILYQFGRNEEPLITVPADAPEELQILDQTAGPSELRAYLEQELKGCAAIVLLDESPVFEAALEGALEDIGVQPPIYREYEAARLGNPPA